MKSHAAPYILTNGPAWLNLTSPLLHSNAALIRSALALKRPGSYLGSMGQHPHHHLEQTGESLAGAAKLQLEQQGEQWTATRAAIFDELAGFEKPASTYDIRSAVLRFEKACVSTYKYRVSA